MYYSQLQQILSTIMKSDKSFLRFRELCCLLSNVYKLHKDPWTAQNKMTESSDVGLSS